MDGRKHSKPEDGAAPAESALAFLSATIERLRDDASQSREMQQRVIQWYGTVLGSVIFGGLVYSTANQGKTVDPVVVVVLYGFVGPAIALISNVLYLGELKRQGRVAAVWRSLEGEVRRTPSLHIPVRSGRIPSLFTESAYAETATDKLTRGYGSTAYYLANLTLFGGGWVLSLAIGLVLTRRAQVSLTILGQSVPVLFLCVAVTLILWVVLNYRLSRTIQILAETTIPIRIPEAAHTKPNARPKLWARKRNGD